MKLDQTKIKQWKSLLENHSLLVTNTIQSVEDLRIFMESHVYAVWDFMSLAKGVQHAIVPSGGVWVPTDKNRSDVSRMINEIILCEETDISADGEYYMSHFDLYLFAMKEVGADTTKINAFIDNVKKLGIDAALVESDIPSAARDFMTHTFSILDQGPHCIAAAFCYGRENVIPSMFKRILYQLELNLLDVPKFSYYLDRHIEVDQNDHGPMSQKIVEILCKNDVDLIYQAENAAVKSIQARIAFFDEVEKSLL